MEIASPCSLEDAMADPTMLIGGKFIDSQDRFDVFNPATGERLTSVPNCSKSQLDDAFVAADGAFPGWASLSALTRGDYLKTAADCVETNLEVLARVLTSELGKPLLDARAEVGILASYLRAFANSEIPAVIIADDEFRTIRVERCPFGVVAVLTPWNGPLSLLGGKVACALALGNTVVLKPSPVTPISSLLVGRIVADVFPPGVFNVVCGLEPLGSWMIAHPVPRKVTFTGSIPVGKMIAAGVADDLKGLTLELGGNDAAIILADADIDKIVEPIFNATFANCGQACVALKRLYVVGDKYDEVVIKISKMATSAVVGDPMEPATRIGPLATESQRTHVESLIADAVSHGGRVAAGGHRMTGPGYFHEITVIADIEDGSRLVDEEQFGPVLPIVRCDSVADAVKRANASNFGLGASVWGTDMVAARDVASQLEAGTVWINAHRLLESSQPFAGWKWSGSGVEKGRWGLEDMTLLRTVYESHS